MRRPRTSTLVALGVCLALLAGAGAVVLRVTRWNGSVTLLANWTGDTQEQFTDKVIRPFERKYRIHVLYQGSSAESQVLAADVGLGTPPDVAVLPGPGELAGYAQEGRLRPLDRLVKVADFGSTWVSPVRGPDDRERTYWIPVKADLKSMVWYPSVTKPGPEGEPKPEPTAAPTATPEPAPKPVPKPATRPALTAAGVPAAAAVPANWCLGMGDGATSGWPGTDWLEDILLQQSGPDVYRRWATGLLSWQDRRVVRAFTTWGTMVGAGRTLDPRRALTAGFDHAADGVTANPPGCRLEHQATFVRGEKPWLAAGPRFVHSSEVIPGAMPDLNAWEVSGDLAGLFSDRPQARKLIEYLASDAAQRAWVKDPSRESGFSADTAVLRDAFNGDRVSAQIASTLRDPAVVRCYDASDAMPTAIRDAFGLAVLQYLADPRTLDRQLALLDNARSHTPGVGLTSVCGALRGGPGATATAPPGR